MKNNIRFLALLLLVATTVVQAQTYQIRAVNKGHGVIGVEMRIISGTPPTTGNFVTDLSFGLKWPSSYGVDLTNSITGSYNIVKSDVRKLKSGFHYQAFSATNTPFAFPAAWPLNGWVEVMSIQNTLTGTGAGSFEVAELGFDATTDPNFGVDLVDFTPLVVTGATDVVLPVRFTAFNATGGSRSVTVQWTTANEQNNKGFEVERSTEQATGFKNIGWVGSKGNNAGNNYIFEDKDVAAKVTYYYRLKQVDNNGQGSYSDIRTARLNAADNKGLRIVPNPVDKVLQVSFEDAAVQGRFSLRIVDSKGSVVLQQNSFAGTGGILRLDVSNLVSGQYFLVVESSAHSTSGKAFYKN